jgi:hypothetical protein
MNFLIIPTEGKPFYTDWFMAENNYAAGMIVFNLYKHTYTKDGKTWDKIEEDHL